MALNIKPMGKLFFLIIIALFYFPHTKANSPLFGPNSSTLIKTFCGQILQKSSTSSTRGSSNTSNKTPASPGNENRIPFFLRKTTTSPGSVVINHIKKSLGENFSERMGPHWASKTESFFMDWKIEEAKEFVNQMESRLGKEDTIEFLKLLPDLTPSDYITVMSKISLFDEYMGKDTVTEKLKEFPEIFFTEVPFGEFRQVIAFIEVYYLGKDAVKRKMSKDPSDLSNLRLSRLQELEHELGHTELRILLMEWSFGNSTL